MSPIVTRPSGRTLDLLPPEPSICEVSLLHWPIDHSQIAQGWRPLVDDFFNSETGHKLNQFLRTRLAAGASIYPPYPWRALTVTPPEDVTVVILGQDPYHGPGQANGLAFDVHPGVKLPPSLRNIHKELTREYGRAPRSEGLLEHWARQGVLLLNSSLTVEAGQPASHAGAGWQLLTNALFTKLAEGGRPLVFMLWGAHAQRKSEGVDTNTLTSEHLWLHANHPSPLSASRPPIPFIGCDHFKRANVFLESKGMPSVDWLGDSL